MAAQEVASLFATLRLNDQITAPLRGVENAISGAGEHLNSLGSRISGLGAAMAGMAAPVVAGFGLAAQQAMRFDESMTNVQAITRQSAEEMAALSAEVLAVGTNSRFGANVAAEAYYDIVGGVSDASTHMAIFQQAIATAEAGNADLGATTSGLISIMNSYGFTAEQAAFASDVLTNTVGMGAGTMDQFAAALPGVTGLAAQTGVSFERLGAMTAYMTTKGFTASEATTRLRSAMTAFLNPNERMREALQRMGVESGSAALELYGLDGTLGRLQIALGGSVDEMAAALGSTEALQAAVVVNEAAYEGFLETFTASVDGVTAGAQAIQNASSAARMDFLRSQMEALAITVGDALLPALEQVVAFVAPVVGALTSWAQENPGVVAAVAALAAGAAVLGAVLIPLGAVIGAIGTAIAFIASPIGIAIAAVAGLAAAYHTNFGGVRDFIDGEVRPRLEGFFNWLGGVWTGTVQPGLAALADWFTTSALPGVVAFVDTEVQPILDEFFGLIGAVWERVSPALGDLLGWFTGTGLPAIGGFVENTIMPIVGDFIALLAGMWDSIAPGIRAVRDNLDSIFGYIRDNIIQPVIDLVGGLIGTIESIPQRLAAAQSGWQTAGQGVGIITGGLASGQFTPGQVLNAIGTGLGIGQPPAPAPAPRSMGGGGGMLGARTRDFGGSGEAGRPYLIGTGAQPELFVPDSSGMFIPNADRLMGNVTITVNVTEGNAYQAGTAFARGLRDRLRERG